MIISSMIEITLICKLHCSVLHHETAFPFCEAVIEILDAFPESNENALGERKGEWSHHSDTSVHINVV